MMMIRIIRHKDRNRMVENSKQGGTRKRETSRVAWAHSHSKNPKEREQ